MNIAATVLSFIFGASLGSFAHLVSDRYRVKSIWGGRSQCMNCGTSLSWKELFPVLSYLFLKGKCKNCKSKLSLSYLWVEIFTGSLVAILPMVVMNMTSVLNYQIVLFFFFSIVIALATVIVIYDLRHSVVPLEVVVMLLALGIVSTITRQYFLGFNVLDFMSGVIVAAPFAILHLISRGKWVGAGDIFVYAACGFIFGLPFSITGFFYSVWIGAFVSISLMLLHKKDYGLRSEIPFAPFIILGMFLAFYSNADILRLHEILY